MSTQSAEAPEYNERVREILRGLARGMTRKDIANESGNKNWKSVDMYMRRRNFIWVAERETYIPKVEPVAYEFSADSTKAGTIIRLLEKEDADVRAIAEQLGFKDHRELAEYMTIKGYDWNAEKSTYQKRLGEVQEDTAKESEADMTSPTGNQNGLSPALLSGQNEDFARYLPLLQQIEYHQDRLMDLLMPKAATGVIPRFIVPGIGKTKTVQMMSTIEHLVVDFSKEKNISQRELFEVALIEFFRKYGYEKEVGKLLGE